MNSNDHYQSVFSSKLNSKSGRNQLHFFLSPLRCCSTKILHLKSKTLINYHVHTFDSECRVRKIRLMARNRNKILLYWSFIASSFIFFFTSGECQEIFYNGFKNAHNNITLNGIAEIESNGVLRLTNDTSRLLGHAFYPSKIRLKSSSDGKALSFSTNFAFGIVPQYAKLGGHGFAFAMVPDKECPGAQPSQYLGLLNSSDNGNFTNHIFAIEFDTVQDFAFGDINDNHVGVDIDSMTSNHSVPAGYFVDGNATVQNLTLQSGKAILVWIDYDSALNLLNVKLSPTNPKPKKNILSYEVDLSPYLNEYMYVGFSGSTGLLASSHYIIGWSFKVNGEATPLDLESLPSLPGPKKVNLGLVLGISIPVFLLMVFVSALIVYMIWKYRNRDVIESWELEVGPHRFPYEELKRATKGFSNKELLGFGGFGKVYKGTLPKCNIEIAVKRISRGSNQGLQEFLSEIASIGKLRHRNLVQLLGWCRRRSDFMLVYEFMPSGSLDKHLFVDQPKAVLNWKQRCNIIKGAAAGLLYLHEGWEQTVIHRDIKSGNVLLDDQLNAKLGDFGLAKLYEHGSSPSTTRVVGTMGYLATEMTRTGKPTTSSDVFAFGALLLEVVCGRRPIEPQALPEDLILVDLVWDKWRDSTILDVVDPKLDGDFEEVEAVLLLKLGLLCSVDDPSSRPTMRQVVRYLEGEVELPDSVAPPSGYNGKKGGARGGGGFEDYAHSYRSSSCFELSTWSMNVERDGDLEVGSTSLSLSTSGER